MIAYLAATFAATWLLWGACARWGMDGGLFALGGPIFLLGVFAPGLMALGFTALNAGAPGVRALASRIVKWDAPVHLYVFALAYTPATRLLAAAGHRLTTGTWPPFGDTPVPVMAAALVISTWVQAGEELGWRGFALPRLSRPVGVGAASLAIGVIWAVWHLPLFLIPGTGSDGQSFFVYLLHVVAISVALGWLYWRSSGSLFLPMLLHAAVNNLGGLVPGALPYRVPVFSFEASAISWMALAVSWGIAAVLLGHMHRARTRP
jgi:membrane protease YdiL (CAAX protease family)